ncbi:hypothetical protein [Burkholderia sp. Ac-20345]|nr:hypothetical protein [Burkholderia sp. Ac-20345]
MPFGDAGNPRDDDARFIACRLENMITGSTKPRLTGLTLLRMTA